MGLSSQFMHVLLFLLPHARRKKHWLLLPPGGSHLGGDVIDFTDKGKDLSLGQLEWADRVVPMYARLEERLGEAVTQRMLSCTQLPGELLYVPHEWEHSVINKQAAVGLSVDIGEFADLDLGLSTTA